MNRMSLFVTGALIWTAAAAFAQPKLVRQARPSYPSEAKEAGISGRVVVEGLIAPDGTVHDVNALSGPPVLADAAVAAVKQWMYAPVTVEGRPVASKVKVTMTFSLPANIQIEDSVGGANSLRPIEMVRPAYPPEAKANGVSGTVKLRAVIGRDGTVMRTSVLSGDAQLAAAAEESVRQWKYEPTLLDGRPVEVVVDIDVNFQLQQ
jgi:TonB family protein